MGSFNWLGNIHATRRAAEEANRLAKEAIDAQRLTESEKDQIWRAGWQAGYQKCRADMGK